jgi:hypothetical protein
MPNNGETYTGVLVEIRSHIARQTECNENTERTLTRLEKHLGTAEEDIQQLRSDVDVLQTKTNIIVVGVATVLTTIGGFIINQLLGR